jgi:hypothetical protein
MVCAATSTVLMTASPIVNCDVRTPEPQAPPGSGSASRSARTDTRVPAGQNCAGRQCSSRSCIQRQAPSTGGSLVTDSRATSAVRAAGSVTGPSRRTATGWPTPTTASSPGLSPAVRTVSAAAVRTVSGRRCSRPAASRATASTR